MSGGALPPCGASKNNQKLYTMNENVNLCEILKDCPKETKFYSPLFGEVTFKEISDNVYDDFPIKTSDEIGKIRTFTSDGRYKHFNKECLLFPSKEQRYWSKWKRPKPKFDPKTLKAFDRVLARDADDREWLALLFSHINTKGKVIVAGCVWAQVIPYNEYTKHLVGTSDEAPEHYRYWED